MNFDELKLLLANLRVPDPSALRRCGLQKLAANFDAYPIASPESKYCILLPAGVAPQAVAKMAEADAAARGVTVLVGGGERWQKLWPASDDAT